MCIVGIVGNGYLAWVCKEWSCSISKEQSLTRQEVMYTIRHPALSD
jgi:hypothetical protein